MPRQNDGDDSVRYSANVSLLYTIFKLRLNIDNYPKACIFTRNSSTNASDRDLKIAF